KVQQERTARLAGEVVAADFYLRQATWVEVVLDLAQQGRGIDTWTWLANYRRDGHSLFDIAETDFSRFLDLARRQVWSGEFERLDRPEHPPEAYLVHRNGYSLEPQEFIQGGPDVNIEQKRRELEEKHRKAAEEQAEWERSQSPSPLEGEGDSREA